MKRATLLAGAALFFSTVIKGSAGKMSERNVERIVKKYADQIRPLYPDIPDKVYPHMFRRTHATGLYQDSVELKLISRILGHSSTETTKIYTALSIEMLTEAMGAEPEDRRKTIVGRKRG